MEAIAALLSQRALSATRVSPSSSITVPQQLSVCGFGDNPLAQAFDPPLSTVRLPRYAIGKVAGEQVLQRMAGEPVLHRTIDLGFELIVRATSAVL